jgi:ankyrin repeat protein
MPRFGWLAGHDRSLTVTARKVSIILLAAFAIAAGNDPPVVEAAKNGNRVALRTLIQQRADLNAPGADGMTALHWATEASDVETVQLLLRAGANAKAASRYGITPLSLAATNGDTPMLDILLKAGADPNAALPEGETILMTASRTGNPDSIRLLLSHGASPNAKENSLGETALMWAAAENHADAVRALIHGGADPNLRSTVLTLAPFKWVTSGMVSTTLPRGGWTALMYAARQNAAGAARALAESGADLNLTDPDGTTALTFAIINAHFDLAAMLLDKGADPNVADETGMASLYAAVDMHTLGSMISRPAPKLVDELDSPRLAKLLLAHGADPNARLKKPVLGRHHDGGDASLGEGTTPLIRAVKTNDIPVIKMLLEAGASPFLTLKDYTTPVMIAAAGGARAGAYAAAFSVTEDGAINVIKLLMDRGADLNAFNTNGQTALHRAAQRGADQLVRFLAENGAKLDMRDKQGRMPVDLALEPTRNPGGPPGRGHESTATLLRSLMSGGK